MMAILGIDFGQRRIGLAIAHQGLAFEYKTLSGADLDLLIEEIGQICQKEKVEKVVVGLAKTAKGKIGFQAKKQQEFGKKLKAKLDIPIVFQNEILSTKEAERILKEQGIKKEKFSEAIDSKSAQLILQSYLDNLKCNT